SSTGTVSVEDTLAIGWPPGNACLRSPAMIGPVACRCQVGSCNRPDQVGWSVRSAKEVGEAGRDGQPARQGPDPTVVFRAATGRRTERLFPFHRSSVPVELIERPQTPTVGHATLDIRRLLLKETRGLHREFAGFR